MNTNTNSRLGRLVLCVAAVLVLGACASGTRLEPAAPVEDRGQGSRSTAPGAAGSGNGAGSVDPNSQSRVSTLDLGQTTDIGAGNAGLPRVIYFDFNSFVVRDGDRAVVEANAKFLNADRKRRMLIEGHTDERGGREFNLALGQKRAEAVVRALSLLGVAESQTEAVSYGKERPAVVGSDESAWAKNRRAELKDR